MSVVYNLLALLYSLLLELPEFFPTSLNKNLDSAVSSEKQNQKQKQFKSMKLNFIFQLLELCSYKS